MSLVHVNELENNEIKCNIKTDSKKCNIKTDIFSLIRKPIVFFFLNDGSKFQSTCLNYIEFRQ